MSQPFMLSKLGYIQLKTPIKRRDEPPQASISNAKVLLASKFVNYSVWQLFMRSDACSMDRITYSV